MQSEIIVGENPVQKVTVRGSRKFEAVVVHSVYDNTDVPIVLDAVQAAALIELLSKTLAFVITENDDEK